MKTTALLFGVDVYLSLPRPHLRVGLGVFNGSVYGLFGFFGSVCSVWEFFLWNRKPNRTEFDHVKPEPKTKLEFGSVSVLTRKTRIIIID